MAWSYSYAEDFILFDYKVTNIGFERLRKVYMGIYVDGDAFHISRNDPTGWNDDVVGFYRTHPAPGGCGFEDTLNIAWHADNEANHPHAAAIMASIAAGTALPAPRRAVVRQTFM